MVNLKDIAGITEEEGSLRTDIFQTEYNNRHNKYTVMLVWTILAFIEDHRAKRKLLNTHFFVQWHEAANTFVIIMWGTWLQRSPVSIANMDRLSNCSSCGTVN